MVSEKKRPFKAAGCIDGRRAAFMACMGATIALWVLLGAVAMAGTPVAFRSADYVLHRIARGDTPQSLAKLYYGNEGAAWRILDANPDTPFKRNTYVVVPLKADDLGGLHPDGYQTVPILCYHRFGEACRSQLCVPTQVFKQQIKYLKDQGYHSVTVEALSDFLQYKRELPSKSVIITIDDGYKSGYDIAYPILKKYGFTAIFFIYTDFVGASKNAVTWADLRELKANGFEVGSHTMSHIDLSQQKPGESRTDYLSRIRDELAGSKALLDKNLNQNTRFIAWPFGRYNMSVLEISEQLGYTMGLTVKRGGNPFFNDPLTLRRDQVLSRKLKTFASRLKTFSKAQLR
jgi:peptidoglycan/xylan/chitin deacetylase (PgdA/CDA1 family)